MIGNAAVVNFSGGETSPKSRGRFDLPWYQTSAKKMRNWIAEMTGPGRYRPGFQFCRQTRGGAVARMITFQVDNNRAYVLEMTPGFLRAYNAASEDLITTVQATITNVSTANPALVTVSSAMGLANGQEVILSGIGGLPELTDRQLVIANLAGNNFNLQDPVTGALLDTSMLGAYTSGGIASVIYEIATPYSATDLLSLQWGNNGSLMYIDCPSQPEQKLTVDSAGAFTLTAVVYTSSPFGTPGPTLNISNIYRSGDIISSGPGNFLQVPAGKTVVALAAGATAIPTCHYLFNGVVGTVQANGNLYLITPGTILVNEGYTYPTTFSVLFLQLLGGSDINSAAWGAYVSGGTAAPNVENPICVAFYEGRKWNGGTNQRPSILLGSRAPDAVGNARYDDFTGGTNADFACFFELAPVSGSVDYASFLRGGPDYLFMGTFGGPYRISGSGLDIPITPTSINVRQFDTAGAEETMAIGCQQIFFIQRGGTTLRSIKVVNPYLATFESADMCLNAEQIPSESPLRRIAFAQGRPSMIWGCRADGALVGMSVHITVQQVDTTTGWHRHFLGGTSAKVQDIGVVERTTGIDQLWAVTQRVVNGVTRCFVEVMADEVVFPDPEDFFTGNEAADVQHWKNAIWRLQERYIHMDAALTYDGSARGAGITLTPSGVSGAGIILTASDSVFNATDVGSEIWKKPDASTGIGAGRALITGYTDPQHITVTTSVDFDSISVINGGDWYFAVKQLYGLWPLENEIVAVVGDGAVISDAGATGDEYAALRVVNGSITLSDFVAVAHVGEYYIGILETHNLEMGGKTGPSQAKPRNISQIFIRFLHSLGVEYGTDLYRLSPVDFRLSNDLADRPPPMFSGIKQLRYQDIYSGGDSDSNQEKNVFIIQRLPLPAIIQSLDLYYDTIDGASEEQN